MGDDIRIGGATNPARLTVAMEKLRALEPDLFGDRTFKCGPICGVDHPADHMRKQIAAHLRDGNATPAVVVSLRPLVIAAYTSDLDAVVLLRFPLTFAVQYNLSVGTRLVAANLFWRDEENGQIYYAADIVPGPERSGDWTHFGPLIAEFLSDDHAAIAALKRDFDAEDWALLDARARTRIERLGLETARNGKPSTAILPAVIAR